MRYINRINCEFNGYAGALWEEHGLSCDTAYRSERDDWILAMVASGLGFGFLPGSCIKLTPAQRVGSSSRTTKYPSGCPLPSASPPHPPSLEWL
jgi:hypothetical protein